MHILLVSNYFEPDAGEAAIRLARLARRLRERGHQLTVLTSLPHYPEGMIQEGYQHRLVVKENRNGITVIQTWLFATPSPRISRKLPSQISFMLTASLRGLGIPRPDVVFIESQPIFTSFAGVFLSLVKRAPYVLNVSDLWPDHLLTVTRMTEKSLMYRLARRLVDFTYRHARHIVTLSPRWAEIIQKHIGPTDKLETIFIEVELDRFRPGLDIQAFRAKYGFSAEKKLVTFVGTFATQYDFETMLDAARVLNRRPDVQVIFIGRGSQDNYVQERLAHEELSATRWIKWIDHSEIPLAWNASYLTFWAMGPHELYQGTVPAKLSEAMCCGIPMVIAAEGVSTQIVQASGAGLAVPCGDKEGLVDAIERLLDNVDFHEQCSRSARQYAEENYDFDRVVERYEALLMNVVRTTSSNSGQRMNR